MSCLPPVYIRYKCVRSKVGSVVICCMFKHYFLIIKKVVYNVEDGQLLLNKA